MNRSVKKYFSFFLLLLFLFPAIEKHLHASEHPDKLHCNATDKHFHQAEHSCSICDYTATDKGIAPVNGTDLLLNVSSFYYLAFDGRLYISCSSLHLPPRAPPVA